MIRGLSICAVWVLTLGILSSSVWAQSATRGKHVFRKCLLCHVLDPDDTSQVAPPLHNILGRTAGQVEGFSYSSIMTFAGTKGFVWTREAMYYFLDKPEDFMPGTYMAFAGLEEQERRDVIAYLEKLTRDFKASQRKRKRSQLRSRRNRRTAKRNPKSRLGQFASPR